MANIKWYLIFLPLSKLLVTIFIIYLSLFILYFPFIFFSLFFFLYTCVYLYWLYYISRLWIFIYVLFTTYRWILLYIHSLFFTGKRVYKRFFFLSSLQDMIMIYLFIFLAEMHVLFFLFSSLSSLFILQDIDKDTNRSTG
jgi:hypothetical protein